MSEDVDLDRRSWLDESIDPANETDLRRWAARYCVTPNELREILEEIGDRRAALAW